MDSKELLLKWIGKKVDSAKISWLKDKSQESTDSNFFSSFSSVVRFVGKGPLDLTPENRVEAQNLLSGWNPMNLTLDEAARIYLILSLPSNDKANHASLLDEALSTSDVKEGIAIHKSLCLLPNPELQYERAREGLRSNNKSFYEAVAHHNPYPYKHFEESAWNQMVLKGLFVESDLYKIYGLDEKTNPTLKQMLLVYSKERWAADRPVYPELWRCVAPLIKEDELPYLEKAFMSDKHHEKLGGALGLSLCPLEEAEEILSKKPDVFEQIKNRTLTWENVNEQP